jgi:hypothetical protein
VCGAVDIRFLAELTLSKILPKKLAKMCGFELLKEFLLEYTGKSSEVALGDADDQPKLDCEEILEGILKLFLRSTGIFVGH